MITTKTKQKQQNKKIQFESSIPLWILLDPKFKMLLMMKKQMRN